MFNSQFNIFFFFAAINSFTLFLLYVKYEVNSCCFRIYQCSDQETNIVQMLLNKKRRGQYRAFGWWLDGFYSNRYQRRLFDIYAETKSVKDVLISFGLHCASLREKKFSLCIPKLWRVQSQLNSKKKGNSYFAYLS